MIDEEKNISINPSCNGNSTILIDHAVPTSKTVTIRPLRPEDDEDDNVHTLICNANMEGSHVKFCWPDPKIRESLLPSDEHGWYLDGLNKSKSATHTQYTSYVMLNNDKELIGHAQIRKIDNAATNGEMDKNSTKKRHYTFKIFSSIEWLMDFFLTFPYSLIREIGFASAFRGHYVSKKTVHGRFLSLIQEYLPQSYEINAFVTHPEYREKGFGKQLFKYLHNEIYSKYMLQNIDLCDVPPIVINTFPSSVGFWKEMKFVVVGQRDCEYFGDKFQDWCLISHPVKEREKEIQDECSLVWNKNKRSNVHLDFIFPSVFQTLLLIGTTLWLFFCVSHSFNFL